GIERKRFCFHQQSAWKPKVFASIVYLARFIVQDCNFLFIWKDFMCRYSCGYNGPARVCVAKVFSLPSKFVISRSSARFSRTFARFSRASRNGKSFLHSYPSSYSLCVLVVLLASFASSRFDFGLRPLAALPLHVSAVGFLRDRVVPLWLIFSFGFNV